MKLKPIKIIDTDGAKLTVQKSGRLGLSKKAAEVLNVKGNPFCLFLEDDDSSETTLFIEMKKDSFDFTLPVRKAGNYFYIKANFLLKRIGIDFSKENQTIIFDLAPPIFMDDGRKVFRLKKRVLKK